MSSFKNSVFDWLIDFDLLIRLLSNKETDHRFCRPANFSSTSCFFLLSFNIRCICWQEPYHCRHKDKIQFSLSQQRQLGAIKGANGRRSRTGTTTVYLRRGCTWSILYSPGYSVCLHSRNAIATSSRHTRTSNFGHKKNGRSFSYSMQNHLVGRKKTVCKPDPAPMVDNHSLN